MGDTKLTVERECSKMMRSQWSHKIIVQMETIEQKRRANRRRILPNLVRVIGRRLANSCKIDVGNLLYIIEN